MSDPLLDGPAPGSPDFYLWANSVHPCRAPFEITAYWPAVEIHVAHGSVSLTLHREYARALAKRILETLEAVDAAEAIKDATSPLNSTTRLN